MMTKLTEWLRNWQNGDETDRMMTKLTEWRRNWQNDDETDRMMTKLTEWWRNWQNDDETDRMMTKLTEWWRNWQNDDETDRMKEHLRNLVINSWIELKTWNRLRARTWETHLFERMFTDFFVFVNNWSYVMCSQETKMLWLWLTLC